MVWNKDKPRYLTPSNAFDLRAIMTAAWAKARYAVKLDAMFKRVSTARQNLAAALRDVWQDARDERSTAEWFAAQPERDAAVTALPDHDRAILDARTALMFAEHSDAHGAHVTIAAARARLAILQAA